MSIASVTSRPSGVKKRIVVLIGLLLIVCISGAAYLFCTQRYDLAKREILDAQQESLRMRATGAAEAMSRWLNGLIGQARQVSTSDLFTLFIAEVQQQGDATTSTINDSDAAEQPDNVDSLVEQLPMMRSQLLEFVNYNEYTNARIVNRKGHTLLSAHRDPAPLDTAELAMVKAILDSGQGRVGHFRSGPAGLFLDLGEPVKTVDKNGDQRTIAALLIRLPAVAALTGFLTQDATAIDKLFLLQQAGVMQAIGLPLGAPAAFAGPAPKGNGLPFALRADAAGKDSCYSLAVPVALFDGGMLIETPKAVVNDLLAAQARMIYGLGALGALGLVLLFALQWWITIGKEQQTIARHFQSLYTFIKQQKQLLDTVNASLGAGLLLASTDGRVQMCNRAFAQIVDSDEEALPGQALEALFGTGAAKLLAGMRAVAAKGASDSLELQLGENETMRLFRVTLFPVEGDSVDTSGNTTENGDKTPVAESSGAVSSVTGIFQDITEFRRRSEMRRRQQVKTIEALMRAIESVDPYLAGHSQRMAKLASFMVREMALPEKDQETVETAARLSQMGKLFIPKELLAKTGKLTPEELAVLKKAPEYAFNVLRDIDFGLPVPRAVHEMSERMDGKGYPQQLAGGAICLHARILAVANAFCAMTSARSYREGMPPEVALASLKKNVGSFDEQVLEVLEKILAAPETMQAVAEADKE